MTIMILAGIAIFVILNLCITVLIRYYSANDGWLDYYRRKLVDKGK